MNVFASALFTALSNGKLSVTISMLRTLVLLLPAVVVFSNWFDAAGVWMAGPFAETVTVIVSVAFFKKNGKRYGYLKK